MIEGAETYKLAAVLFAQLHDRHFVVVLLDERADRNPKFVLRLRPRRPSECAENRDEKRALLSNMAMIALRLAAAADTLKVQ